MKLLVKKLEDLLILPVKTLVRIIVVEYEMEQQLAVVTVV